MDCQSEVQLAIDRIVQEKGRSAFSFQEVVGSMETAGTSFSEGTIKSTIKNMSRTGKFERIAPGAYVIRDKLGSKASNPKSDGEKSNLGTIIERWLVPVCTVLILLATAVSVYAAFKSINEADKSAAQQLKALNEADKSATQQLKALNNANAGIQQSTGALKALIPSQHQMNSSLNSEKTSLLGIQSLTRKQAENLAKASISLDRIVSDSKEEEKVQSQTLALYKKEYSDQLAERNALPKLEFTLNGFPYGSLEKMPDGSISERPILRIRPPENPNVPIHMYIYLRNVGEATLTHPVYYVYVTPGAFVNNTDSKSQTNYFETIMGNADLQVTKSANLGHSYLQDAYIWPNDQKDFLFLVRVQGSTPNNRSYDIAKIYEIRIVDR